MFIRKFIFIAGLLSCLSVYSQNEDFEVSVSSPITSSTQVPGWLLTSASNTLNSNALTRFCDSLIVPIQASVITHSSSSGYIDPIIGQQYPIFSVFGPGVNAGQNDNPQVGIMSGTSFFKIGIYSSWSSSYVNFYEVSKKMKVDVTNCVFKYAYIFVGNSWNWQCHYSAIFKARVSNITTSSVITAHSKVVSSYTPCTTIPFEYLYNGSGGSYNKWKIITLDLSPYIGDSIKIEYVTNNITGNYFSYAYLDTYCAPGMIRTNGILNTSDSFTACSNATLSAPNGYNYQWTGPNTNTNAQTVVVNTSGSYTLALSQGSTVIGTQVVNANIVTPLPISFSAAKDTICAGESTTITIDYNNIGHLTSFTWWNPLSSAPSKVVSPNITSDYCLSGTDTNGCETQFCKQIYVNQCVGLKNLSIDHFEFEIYPNPNSGNFTIRSQINESVMIYDNLGKLLQTVNLSDENAHVVQISGYKPGFYLIRCREKVFKMTITD